MKRKFKILILTISVIAMLCAFALTSSALEKSNSNDSIIYFPGDSSVCDLVNSNSVYLAVAPEAVECSFTLALMDLSSSFDGMTCAVVLNPYEFQSFCDHYSITGQEDIFSVLTTLGEDDTIYSSEGFETWFYCFSNLNLSKNAFDYLYNYDPLTQEEYEADIEASKLTGVEEFKVSEEYLNTLNFAKTSGVEEFKNSTEYNEALLSKYNEGHSVGTSAGMTSYKSSSEYKNALSEKYNEGYDVGFSDGEKSFDLAPMIVGILVLASMAICLIVYNQKRRKKYRR